MKKFAIFFPQFYATHVNNQAWGYGFTDWSLLSTANAFSGWSRRAPASGFYDLSKNEDIHARFCEARQAKLDGFGIYHYRFNDGPELNTVENFLLNTSGIDNFSFFLIWANENWSKRWAGEDTDLLKTISSAPSRREIADHVAYLAPLFQLTNYEKINDRPIFVIYRPDFFQDMEAVLQIYRSEFKSIGLNPAIGFFLKNSTDVVYSGLFDFCYLFEPRLYQNMSGFRKFSIVHSVFKKLLNTFNYSLVEFLSTLFSKLTINHRNNPSFDGFLKYFNSIQRQQIIESIECPVQNVLTVGWNNFPRYRENFTEIVEVPNLSQISIMMDLASSSLYSDSIPLLCNAWNEWSEGAAIEPCHYLGDYLLKSYTRKGDTV